MVGWLGAAILAFEAGHAEPPRTYLASITGIALGPNEYVDGFTIDTWGVDFLAVCRIPPGWHIRAGRSAAPDGVLEGEATHGVTFINQPSRLRALALIRLHGPVEASATTPGIHRPATFAGRIEIGTYGDGPRRQAPLSQANIQLVPAEHCPPPSH